ncbi:MAG: glycosyltransferase, partial [Actinomycetota bacterium]
MGERLDTHGLLITFRRPDALTDHLARLARQTRPLTSLLVVDNDDDPAIRDLIEGTDLGATVVTYLGLAGNPGPAGAIAAGIAAAIETHDREGWLVLLDDDDPPPRDDTLEALADVVDQLGADDPNIGGVGLWGSRLERSGRLRAATGTSPEPVAYLPGGACPHYRIGALRAVGGPDPDLFFGFDDLDLGLAVGRAGAPGGGGGGGRRPGGGAGG